MTTKGSQSSSKLKIFFPPVLKNSIQPNSGELYTGVNWEINLGYSCMVVMVPEAIRLHLGVFFVEAKYYLK